MSLHGINTAVIAGGVSANERIREYFAQSAKVKGIEVVFPPPDLSTDNAAMIGYAGYFKKWIDPLESGQEFLNINAHPGWEL